MKTLILIRGLPGSGKTTLAERLTCVHVCADDYFTDKGGNYNFEHERIHQAHAFCLDTTKELMSGNTEVVAVHNTFVKLDHMQPYLDLAKEKGYAVSEIVCTNHFGSTHGVPKGTLERMRRQWEVRHPVPSKEGFYWYREPYSISYELVFVRNNKGTWRAADFDVDSLEGYWSLEVVPPGRESR